MKNIKIIFPYTFHFLILTSFAHFQLFLRKRDGPMDRRPDGPMDQWTNGPMDQWTDTPSYRDARPLRHQAANENLILFKASIYSRLKKSLTKTKPERIKGKNLATGLSQVGCPMLFVRRSIPKCGHGFHDE